MQRLHTMFIIKNRVSFHFWRKENMVNHQNSEIIMKMIVGKGKLTKVGLRIKIFVTKFIS